MKTNTLHTFILGAIAILLIACTEEKREPWENNTNPPGQVSNVTIINQPAQATITYTLPKDQDLLYIKAVYPLNSGAIREVKASYYTNSMVLDGFGVEGSYDVKLYAVNRSEMESEPVTIQVNPLKNPIWDVYESMEIMPDFAGVRIIAKNDFKANVTIEFLRKNEKDEWEKYGNDIYTSLPEISNTNRGFDTIPELFGATVRDRFMNYTDTVFTTVKPLYEESLDKGKFREVRLPGDAAIQTVTPGMPQMWNGSINPYDSQRMLTSTESSDPQWITFDLGQVAKLSRFKFYNYHEFVGGKTLFYYRGQLRYFELWGTAQYSPDGSFDGWTQLGTYEVIKPSGLPYGEQSTEDYEKALQGFEFNVDPDAPKVRYLRIKSNQNWEGTTWMEILEIFIYGDTRN